MSSTVPPLVTLHLWRLPSRRQIPAALGKLATDRIRLRRAPGVRFAKLLGTSRSFTPTGADLTRWGLLTCWASAEAAAAFEQHPVLRGWDHLARERFRADLVPLRSVGRWSGQAPFGDPAPRPAPGRVAALTRARLRPRRAARFWAAIGPVAADLQQAPGLLASLGIGELPVGMQGTVSLWQDEHALKAFTCAPVHASVMARTSVQGWYAEQLFARFEVRATCGTLDGRDLS